MFQRGEAGAAVTAGLRGSTPGQHLKVNLRLIMLKNTTFFLNTSPDLCERVQERSQVTCQGWTQGCVLLLDLLLLFLIPKVRDFQSSIDGGGDVASVIQCCTFPCVGCAKIS